VNAPYYRKEISELKYSVTTCAVLTLKTGIVKFEKTRSLKEAAIKCLIDNNVRAENECEEYFYKKVVPRLNPSPDVQYTVNLEGLCWENNIKKLTPVHLPRFWDL